MGMTRTRIGLDIGASGVRAAEVSMRSIPPALVRVAQAPMPEGAFSGGEVKDPDAVAEAMKAFSSLVPAGAKGGTELTYKLDAQHVKRIMENAVDQALETIRNRIDQFGVAETTIQRQGSRNIVVQLPGVKDAERAIQLIGNIAVDRE